MNSEVTGTWFWHGGNDIKRELIFLGCGVLGGALIGFGLGSQFYSSSMDSMRQKVKAHAALVADHEAQQQQLVNLEMADQVNRLAQEKLRQRVTELQTERVKVETDLYVYKKLLEDDETEAGLSLESLLIREVEGESREFNYDIVLRRKEASSQSIEATLSVEIEGQLHGIPFAVSFREADPELSEESLSVTFKYFKIVKGKFVLPEFFEPSNVVLSLYEKGHADSLVIKEIHWQPLPI